MELDPQEVKDGTAWFFGAGLISVFFCCFLYYTDFALSTSDKEEQLGKTLHELRVAQATVAGAVSEDRLTVPLGSVAHGDDLHKEDHGAHEDHHSEADAHSADHSDGHDHSHDAEARP